jgi:thymidylate synthase (FAD)
MLFSRLKQPTINATKRLASTATSITLRDAKLYKPRVYKYTHEVTSANLVSYSKPSDAIKANDVDTLEDLVAYCARVSNPTNQNNKTTNKKLLNYLIKNNHWSPFETVSACVEINAPRDIARQILRHRSFSFQEFSQRYADPTRDMTFVLRDPRKQDLKNRQNSIVVEDIELHDEWFDSQVNIINNALDAYQYAITRGIAKEQARAVLPEGNTMSRIYMNGTLRSWMHYIDLRTANGTQQEHMNIAKYCANALSPIFPMFPMTSV